MFAVSILKNASGKNTCFLLACTDAMVSDENFKNCRFNPLLRNVVKWSDTLEKKYLFNHLILFDFFNVSFSTKWAYLYYVFDDIHFLAAIIC